MTFLRAVGRFYGRYAQFGGRAGRAEFWWAVLHLFLLSIVVTVLFELLGAETSAPGAPWFALPAVGVTGLTFPPLDWMTAIYHDVSGVLGLLHIVPMLSLTARRLSDAGLTPVWMLLGLIPGLGAIALFVMVLQPSAPRESRADGSVGGSPRPTRPDRSGAVRRYQSRHSSTISSRSM